MLALVVIFDGARGLAGAGRVETQDAEARGEMLDLCRVPQRRVRVAGEDQQRNAFSLFDVMNLLLAEIDG